MSLYPYQEACVRYALEHHYSLNCCEMGLGKSRIALSAAKRSGERLAVFGPAFLRSTWEREAIEAGIDFTYFPYSMLHKVEPREVKDFGFWVADECHYLKTPTTNRTHAFYSLLKGALPEYFLGLTGTPIKNRAYDFWTLLAFCGVNPRGTSGPKLSGEMTRYRSFCRHFCESSLVKMNGARFEKFGAIKPERIPEFKSLLEGKYIRFTVEKVLKDLPEFTRKDVVLSGIKPDLDLLEVFNLYQAGRKVDVTAKARSAMLKAKSTAEYVADMAENGVDKAVVFSDHLEPVSIIAAELNNSARVTGKTSMTERQEIVKEFQNGGLNYIVATIGAMSVGVTLTAASHVVFNDLSWTPAENLQAEKRIHRIGQKAACFAHYIHATPTDLHIKKVLEEKLCTVNALVN